MPTTLLPEALKVYGVDMATLPEPNLITSAQFLQIDFGPDIKAELDNGIIRMMAGGTAAHARVQSNTMLALGVALRGTGCRPYGSDMAVNTYAMSVRYPDISVYCGKDSEIFDNVKAFDDPVVLIEIISPSTAAHDQGTKLNEYRALPSVHTILLIDPSANAVRSITRTGPKGWTDDVPGANEDIAIPHLGIALSQGEIFAR